MEGKVGAFKYHYYEIRTVDPDGNVQRSGRGYVRELTRAETFAIGMSLGGPTAKVVYVGRGHTGMPSWWTGEKNAWTVYEEPG